MKDKGQNDVRFEANAEARDFPIWENEVPNVCCVIASTPRCGSTLLSKMLSATEVCGFLHEYFNRLHVEDFDRRWDIFPVDMVSKRRFSKGRKRATPDFERYCSLLFRHRTSPNGVFGTKIHYCHIDNRVLGGRWPHRFLPNARFIHIYRKNTVRQAISHVKKGLLGVEQVAMRENCHKLVYDGPSLRESKRWIEAQNQKWRTYFSRFSIEFRLISYEELMQDIEGSVRSLLEFVGVDFVGDLGPIPTRSESDQINLEWEQRFRVEYPEEV